MKEIFKKKKSIFLIILIIIVIVIVSIVFLVRNNDKEKVLVSCKLSSNYDKIHSNIEYKFTLNDDTMKIYQIYSYSIDDEDQFDKLKEIIEFSADLVKGRIDLKDEISEEDVLIETAYTDTSATLIVTHIINEENKYAMNTILDYDYYSSGVDEIYDHLTEEGDLVCEKY